MEEKETGETEPVDLRSAEQSELLSLIISGEEETTQEGSDLGAPGPSGRKPRVQRASRPGLSRIPGRDHRRYYHEYWRSEYLMDFDPQRHGMICMVCGSSLATLKLSTIKRHIRQKHPDSLLWSAADKEVIRSGWESHLSLGGGQRTGSASSLQGEEDSMHFGQHIGETPDPVLLEEHPQQPPTLTPRPVEDETLQPPEEANELPGPSARTLERYLNDSLHAWFRQEFLMEYEAEASRLLCMVCGAELPSLHLDHIKSHVLESHPNSLVYSSEEKHCILQAWAQTHGEADSIKTQPTANTKGKGADLFTEELKSVQMDTDVFPQGESTLTQDVCLIGEDGGVGAPQLASQPLRQPRKRRLRGGDPWRLRLDYLVAYGPQDQGTFCMVCSQVLHESKVSSFRRHIQECHPETTTLSRQEREAMAAAWTKDSADGVQIPDVINPGEAVVFSTTKGRSEDPTSDVKAALNTVKMDERVRGGRSKSSDSGTAASVHRHGHYPGKDQRRNYQVRWRMDYLMDYDCRRHGLICMVCGATLATLKVSTIKRHIQQVHPHSLLYGAEEKEQALLSYNQTALHFVHSDDCFSTQDHGHTEAAPSPAQFGT
ncbi:uncharacterized protein C11orf95 homolog isoform X2 [Fundulus heteroclitus]|uniref:uncharacterized protein C11orf95 homolog isoform X2 n=1 Tax=Fundulus heteroclitus TaxID=8078 RepID=UPI00165B6D3C|nr:uncharacterized protein C11orf95 homolog isoform X2 [Fundulus heteroclitus]